MNKNPTPLWHWDVDQWSLQGSSTDRLLAWMAKLQREAFIEAFTALPAKTQAATSARVMRQADRMRVRGTHATSREEQVP